MGYNSHKAGTSMNIKKIIYLILAMLVLPLATVAQDNSCSQYLTSDGSGTDDGFGSNAMPDGGWCNYVEGVADRGEQADAYANCKCAKEKSMQAELEEKRAREKAEREEVLRDLEQRANTEQDPRKQYQLLRELKRKYGNDVEKRDVIDARLKILDEEIRALIKEENSGQKKNERVLVSMDENLNSENSPAIGSGSSQAMVATSEDPELMAQRQRLEASRRQMADFRRTIEEQNRKKAQLNTAASATMDEWAQGNFIEGSESLATEFARQGNAGAAYGTVALGVIAEIGSMIKKDKEEEKRREQAAAQRRRQEELYLRRQQQLEREALRMLIEQRHLILDTFSNSTPIPLASSKVGTDRIYYFVYSFNRSTIDQRHTEIYVSNVFEIAQYNDGTWPYQSRINEEIQPLIPYSPTLNGYYTSREEADMMRNEFVVSFENNEGVAIKEFEYEGKPASNTTSSGLDNPLGVSLDNLQDTTVTVPTEKNGLGISITPKKKKSNNQ